MYKRYLNLPIQTKLLSIAAVILVVVTYVICFYFPNKERHQIMDAMTTKVGLMTEMLALGVAGGLSVGDFEALQRAVDWAKQDEDFLYLAILDEDNAELNITNPKDITVDLDAVISHEGVIEVDGALFKVFPMQQKNVLYGTAILGFSLERSYSAITKARLAAFSAGIVVLLMFGFAIWVIRKAIIGPVIQLQQSAGKVASGITDVQVEVTSTDEVGRLCSSFNSMVASMKQAQEDVQAEKASVERKIEEAVQESEVQKQYLSKSVDRMLSEMEKFADGDLTVSLEAERPDDEIGQLSSVLLVTKNG